MPLEQRTDQDLNGRRWKRACNRQASVWWRSVLPLAAYVEAGQGPLQSLAPGEEEDYIIVNHTMKLLTWTGSNSKMYIQGILIFKIKVE